MGAIARLGQSLPLVIALVVLAVGIYFFVSWTKSPMRAKEVLIKVFTILTLVLSGFFLLASLYALFENNWSVLELTGMFLAIALIALAITRICRWRMLKRYPEYKDKRYPTEYL